MNIETEIAYLDSKIQSLQAQRKILADNAEFLAKLDCSIFESCGKMHFAQPNREDTLAIVRHFGGKWDKSYNEDKVNYDYRDAPLSIYGGSPPETCRVVEEEIEVPAHKKIVRHVVCEISCSGVIGTPFLSTLRF